MTDSQQDLLDALAKVFGITDEQRVESDRAVVDAAKHLVGELAARDVEALVGVKITRGEAAAFKELALSNRPLFEKMVAERQDLRTVADEIIARDVDALVGVKITPAEAPLFEELAKLNHGLFKRMVGERRDLQILGRIMTAPEAIEQSTATAGFDNGQELASLLDDEPSAERDADLGSLLEEERG
jgi:hypothetical protein